MEKHPCYKHENHCFLPVWLLKYNTSFLPLAMKGFLPTFFFFFFPFSIVNMDMAFVVMEMQELGYFLRQLLFCVTQ